MADGCSGPSLTKQGKAGRLLGWRLTTDSQRRDYSDAFIAPVVLTWKGHFQRELLREDSLEESPPPAGSLIGAILTMSGTVQGFAVYYFDARTAIRAADRLGSLTGSTGGDLEGEDRPDQLIKKLPKSLRHRIGTHKSKGYRIKP